MHQDTIISVCWGPTEVKYYRFFFSGNQEMDCFDWVCVSTTPILQCSGHVNKHMKRECVKANVALKARKTFNEKNVGFATRKKNIKSLNQNILILLWEIKQLALINFLSNIVSGPINWCTFR